MKRILAAVFAAMFVLGGIALAVPVNAQGNATPTPQPTPNGNGGNATWTVNSMTFTSNYPKGFEIKVEAESSAGKITSGLGFWRHTAVGSRTRRPVVVAEDGKSAVARYVPAGGGFPQWVGIEYWFVLTDEAGNTYETPHAMAEYEDNTRNWTRMESDDIIIVWEEGVPDEIGPETIDAMQKARRFYQRHFPRPLGYKPRAIVFSSYRTWEETRPGVSTSAGGVRTVGSTDDVWGTTVQVYVPGFVDVRETAYGTIPHEVAHLYQTPNGINLSRQPFWFVEGHATFFELTPRDRMVSRVRGLAIQGTLPTLQGGGPSARGAFARDAYDIGYMFFEWLVQTHGDDALFRMHEVLVRGRPWQEALQTVTGMNFLDQEVAFRSWLGARNAVPPTLVPEPTLFFFPSPTYEPTPKR